MAMRLPSSRLVASLTSKLPAVEHRLIKRFASTSPAASVSSNHLGDKTRAQTSNQASISNPDPLSGSPSAQLLNEHEKYMVATYVRPSPVFTSGEGCYLYDLENRKYLDFTAGIAVNALGHCDAEVSKILGQQSKILVHTSNLYYNPWTLALSKLLVETTLASGGMHNASQAFICNSGSEANEAALKFSRKVARVIEPSGSKYEVLSFHHSFHGRTFGSLSATPTAKYQKPFSPMVPGFNYAELNCGAQELEQLITDKTAAVIVEPIQGEGGIHVATPEFLTALRARCTATNTVLIYDEIQCGLGRTGKLWAHGSLPPSAHPDIFTTAKALGNGFPIAATIVSGDVGSKIKPGDHGTTFGGNPLACRVAHHVLNRLASSELQSSVLSSEQIFRSRFEKLMEKYPNTVTEIRGKGLLLGLQLSCDPNPIVAAARERGLLVITAGTNTLRIVPPLIISEKEINKGCEILEEALKVVLEAQQ
ncbi:MAG: acetylornithine aminotransferase [Cirrosporium novae-zelandiae]|nr:MAG: acetylornithine aminotransferase [Cirrosporium novae-zelandiae]